MTKKIYEPFVLGIFCWKKNATQVKCVKKKIGKFIQFFTTLLTIALQLGLLQYYDRAICYLKGKGKGLKCNMFYRTIFFLKLVIRRRGKLIFLDDDDSYSKFNNFDMMQQPAFLLDMMIDSLKINYKFCGHKINRP